MAYCHSWYFRNSITGEISLFKCKLPRCNHRDCIQAWSTKRLAIFIGVCEKYGLNKFFTLTLDRSIELEERWRNIPFIWLKMRHRLQRIAKKRNSTFLFIAGLEAQKDGTPHIHGFTNLWLEQIEWSRLWNECGGGTFIWIEKVDDYAKIGDYVNKEIEVYKYVGKDNLETTIDHIAKRKRTYWRSKKLWTDFEIEKKKKEEYNEEYGTNWELIKGV